MFSDHELTRKFLWIDLLKNCNFGDSPYLIFHLILSVIFVLILGWIIDLIRKNSVEKISNVIVDILDDKIFKRVVCKKMGGRMMSLFTNKTLMITGVSILPLFL